MKQCSIPSDVVIGYLCSIGKLLRHPLASNAGVLAFSQYVATGVKLLTTIVAARLLGPKDYGVVSLSIAYPMLLWSFVSIKSISVTTRYIANFRSTGQKEDLKAMCNLGYKLDFFASIIAFVLVSITGGLVARYVYNMPSISWLMIAYGTSFPFLSLVGNSIAILTSWHKFRLLAALQICEQIIIFIFVFGFLVAGYGVPGVIFGMAGGNAVIGLIMFGAATIILSRDGIDHWWKASFRNLTSSLRKELAAFFGWNYLMVTLSGLLMQVPLMFLGRLRGPEEAGYYRIAMSIMTVGSYLETSLGRVSYPILSTRWDAKDQENLKRSLELWTLRLGIPAGVLILFIVPLLSITVPIILGPNYTGMVLGAQVMVVGAAISAMFFWLIQFYYISGNVGLWTKLYGFYTGLTIALGWLVIQHGGFLGLAFLVTAGKILFLLVSLVISFRRF